ncbi:MAG: HesA/MoeB/ThiF family protein [Nitrospiraceae bacterium]|nr:HesA/MoeB/ThiF family protein [Nitrospiraceae bacterium]
MNMEFTPDQLQRYHRQMILRELGAAGQQKISDAKVFIAGAGGLGSPAGYYLAAAGIGTLAIADNDLVELSNLQRQIAHNTERIGMLKSDSAQSTFKALNPEVNIISITQRIIAENVAELIRDFDIVVDCTDNFAVRYLLNDACVLMNKPLVSGAVAGFKGHLTTIIPGQGHCFRCIFEEMPPDAEEPSCRQAGVLGAFAGVIGAMQAMEVLKLVTGAGEPLKNTLLIYDGLKSEFRRVNAPRNKDCPVCGDDPYITIPGC